MTRWRCSERQFRAKFAGCLPLDIAPTAWAKARRLARGRFRKKRGGLGRRSYRAFNCYGKRIWCDKWRAFGGMKWRAACATVQKNIERREAREWRAVAERWAVAAGVPF